MYCINEYQETYLTPEQVESIVKEKIVAELTKNIAGTISILKEERNDGKECYRAELIYMPMEQWRFVILMLKILKLVGSPAVNSIIDQIIYEIKNKQP